MGPGTVLDGQALEDADPGHASFSATGAAKLLNSAGAAELPNCSHSYIQLAGAAELPQPACLWVPPTIVFVR